VRCKERFVLGINGEPHTQRIVWIINILGSHLSDLYLFPLYSWHTTLAACFGCFQFFFDLVSACLAMPTERKSAAVRSPSCTSFLFQRPDGRQSRSSRGQMLMHTLSIWILRIANLIDNPQRSSAAGLN
jgi:hypothetical protein